MRAGYDPTQDLVTLAEVTHTSAADRCFQETDLNAAENYHHCPEFGRTNYFHQKTTISHLSESPVFTDFEMRRGRFVCYRARLRRDKIAEKYLLETEAGLVKNASLTPGFSSYLWTDVSKLATLLFNLQF